MEVIKLPKEVDETALAETVLDTGMVGDSGEELLEVGNPALGEPGGDEVHFVEDDNQVFVGEVAFEVFFNVFATGA